MDNTVLDPTKIKNAYWVHVYDSAYSNTPSNSGKWMLHFFNNQLYSKWTQALNLFQDENLPGVSGMKCSTGLINPRAYGSGKMGIIIFYCDRSSEEKRINEIGKQIQQLMDYDKPMYYKTDEQTEKGTRKTGQLKLYLQNRCS